MRTALIAASLALVAGTTVGCGGGPGGPPTDATEDEFCSTFEDFYTEATDLGAEPSDEDVLAVFKKIGDKLDEVGTPEGIPEDARGGFELLIQTIEDLPEDTTQEDLSTLEDEFSDAEQEQSDAFDEYLTETCEPPGGEPDPGTESETEPGEEQ